MRANAAASVDSPTVVRTTTARSSASLTIPLYSKSECGTTVTGHGDTKTRRPKRAILPRPREEADERCHHDDLHTTSPAARPDCPLFDHRGRLRAHHRRARGRPRLTCHGQGAAAVPVA